ncbi:hypothetical protein [Prevotella denticola]|uniref:hypothetical protein n=1 Tax=Prevotella denticola TaxID=28129 RepID=UPI000E5968E7|nr:hypothetical protein [Prevotella denticola]AXV50091.1 hypothetical protein DYJ25_09665 [Prevotella denticola]
MKKVNIKSILLLSMLFLQAVTLKAQNDLTRIYGVYAGTAKTEIETAGGSMKQPGERKFQVEIVKRANDTKLILKDYKLGNYEFEEIVFDNFDQYYQPEKKGWNFFTDPLSGKYLKTKDNNYTIQLWGNPIDDYCFVYENGTMDFTFEIYTNPERKVKHVFKGKKLDTDGINSLSARHDKDVIYNLHGHRTQRAQKGLYIVNGKKVLLNNK